MDKIDQKTLNFMLVPCFTRPYFSRVMQNQLLNRCHFHHSSIVVFLLQPTSLNVLYVHCLSLKAERFVLTFRKFSQYLQTIYVLRLETLFLSSVVKLGFSFVSVNLAATSRSLCTTNGTRTIDCESLPSVHT